MLERNCRSMASGAAAKKTTKANTQSVTFSRRCIHARNENIKIVRIYFNRRSVTVSKEIESLFRFRKIESFYFQEIKYFQTVKLFEVFLKRVFQIEKQ